MGSCGRVVGEPGRGAMSDRGLADEPVCLFSQKHCKTQKSTPIPVPLLLSPAPCAFPVAVPKSRGFHRRAGSANQREGLANPNRPRKSSHLRLHLQRPLPPVRPTLVPLPPLHPPPRPLSSLALQPSFFPLTGGFLCFSFSFLNPPCSASMLGRTVLRSVPSPGLARQFVNRASTVRTSRLFRLLLLRPCSYCLGDWTHCGSIGTGENVFNVVY